MGENTDAERDAVEAEGAYYREQGRLDREREIDCVENEHARYNAEAHAPMNAVCEKCGRRYCDHGNKY